LLQLWEQQELEIQGAVQTQGDLPAPDADAETVDGQRRRYLVVDERVIYRDDGSQWNAIGGAGLFEQHADQHHSDGDDTLDAGALGGASGADGDVLFSDGSAAFWAEPPTGLGVGDFAHETGTITVGALSYGTFTTSVSLSNSYQFGIPAAGGISRSDVFDADSFSCGADTLTTSGGDVVGFDISGVGRTDVDMTVRWHFFGVLA
jgi:hypothetical protein